MFAHCSRDLRPAARPPARTHKRKNAHALNRTDPQILTAKYKTLKQKSIRMVFEDMVDPEGPRFTSIPKLVIA
jgi:hypothetical protein